ncbi:leucine/isoleucine/valine transporter ATP-binding subunit [compost metagenome]
MALLRTWIGRLSDEGISILLVSHDMGLMGISHVVHALYLGKIIATGSMADVQADPLVKEAYLGG